MRSHRFYIEEKLTGKQSLEIKSAALINQWRRVLRFNPGARVILFDGSGGEFVCEIVSIKNDSAEVSIMESKKCSEPTRKIVLFQSLVKKDKMEWITEKATELGVSEIVPVISERSEKKSLNEDRLKKILVEASEQSGRCTLPKLHRLQNLSDVLGTLDPSSSLVFDPSGSPFSSLDSRFKILDSIFFFIGPEGGFTPSELELFKSKNIPVVSLGSQILRAETAAIAALALLILK